MKRIAANLVLYHVGWFACILGAAYSLGWVGGLVVMAHIAIHLKYLSKNAKAEFLLFVIVAIVGIGIDTLQYQLGAYLFKGHTFPVIPLWLCAMWLNFGPLLPLSLAWLKGRYLTSAVLGMLGGPLAYWGGERLGAVEFGLDLSQVMLRVAIAYGLAMPLFIRIMEKIESYSQGRE